MTTICKHCGKTFDEAVFYGCKEWPCNSRPKDLDDKLNEMSPERVSKITQRAEELKGVSREDIMKARQKITDVKNTLQVSSLVHICGYPVEDLVSTLEDSISHLNGDQGENAWRELVKEAQELGLY